MFSTIACSPAHRRAGDQLLHVGEKGLGLLYLDIDAHHPWQTDEHRAKAVLKKVFPIRLFPSLQPGTERILKSATSRSGNSMRLPTSSR